jgi:hypothetical protein
MNIIKKEKLLEWNDDKIYQTSVEERINEWKQIYPDSETPSKEFIEKEFMDDLPFYWRSWDNFLSDLQSIIQKKHPYKWENLSYYNDSWKTELTARKALRICGIESPNKLEVYNIQKNGLLLRGTRYRGDVSRDCIFLPACERGYHRDWDRDGICVKSIFDEEPDYTGDYDEADYR